MPDAAKHLVVVNCVPDGRVDTPLVAWLHKNGLCGQVVYFNADVRVPFGRLGQGLPCDSDMAWNLAIKHVLTAKKWQAWDLFFFLERDVVPFFGSVGPFWDSDCDIVGAEYPTGCDAFSEPGIIHFGCWRSSRGVLDAMPRPHCRHTYNADHTAIECCFGANFSRKAKSLGFSVAVVGRAHHLPRDTRG